MNLSAAETAGYAFKGKELATPCQNHVECTGAFNLAINMMAAGSDSEPAVFLCGFSDPLLTRYNIGMAKVKCELCPTECVLGDYEVGGCRVRVNRGGELYSLVYGKPCSVHVDPIEKKPFFHFLPGTFAFSIATVGCTLGCTFCQNWEISQARPEEADHLDLPPADVVRSALAARLGG